MLQLVFQTEADTPLNNSHTSKKKQTTKKSNFSLKKNILSKTKETKPNFVQFPKQNQKNKQ